MDIEDSESAIMRAREFSSTSRFSFFLRFAFWKEGTRARWISRTYYILFGDVSYIHSARGESWRDISHIGIVGVMRSELIRLFRRGMRV